MITNFIYIIVIVILIFVIIVSLNAIRFGIKTKNKKQQKIYNKKK